MGIIQISPLPSVLDAITITEKNLTLKEKQTAPSLILMPYLQIPEAVHLSAERAPGISVDQNGNIKLKGRAGETVYVDDKPTYLGGAELENYLRSIPTSTVKQIEIMTNPPARYEQPAIQES
ncbi:MAG: hypothetical protein IPI53_00025 [Saprospiraceae bacterium]|nr:hypothetical protein [Saprospiraceae bacterium]